MVIAVTINNKIYLCTKLYFSCMALPVLCNGHFKICLFHDMRKQILKKSFLFPEMGKSVACFTKWTISQIVHNICIDAPQNSLFLIFKFQACVQCNYYVN